MNKQLTSFRSNRLMNIAAMTTVAVIVALLATSIFAIPIVAQAASCSCSISLSPIKGAVGKTVTVTGSSFASSATVTITFNGNVITTATSDSSGAFTASFAVPTTPAGSYVVIATDGLGNTASKTFKVVSSATLSPIKGKVGSTVTVSGTGFASSAAITVTLGSTTFSLGTSSTAGSFSSTVTIPNMPGGKYTATISDGTNTVSKSFKVVSNLLLSPKRGAAGSLVSATLTGFGASSLVIITFNGAQVASGTTTSTGYFFTTFNVPSDAAGHYTVQATDSSSNTAKAKFAIS